MKMKFLDICRQRLNELGVETYAVFLAYKDPRVPWYAKVLIACIIGYAFSPIDKVLDSIPILGYLDHLLLVPAGFAWAFRKMIPLAVLVDCREKALTVVNRRIIRKSTYASTLILMWVLFVLSISVSAVLAMKDWNAVLRWWLRWFMKVAKIGDYLPAQGGV